MDRYVRGGVAIDVGIAEGLGVVGGVACCWRTGVAGKVSVSLGRGKAYLVASFPLATEAC